MEPLRYSDNGRYFVRSDGSPFPFLADTGWTVPARLKWDDVEVYLQTRKAQGFTVLQLVVLDPEWNPDLRSPSGQPAFLDGNICQPNPAYFDYVDYVLGRCEAYGFYVLLLPAWGQLVTGDDWGGGVYEKLLSEDNAYQYGAFLGRRERHRHNILWCLGGDRMPIHKGVDYRSVWRRLAEGLALGLTGENMVYNLDHARWKELMITYHACYDVQTGQCSTFSQWDSSEDVWIGFCMLQSGHGTTACNWKLLETEYARTPVFPVWDGESAYERMPTSWPITPETEFHNALSVRRRAFSSLFAGAFGFTYGHASVWCTVSEKERNELASETWWEAIHSEGSWQMKYLRDFLEYYQPQCCVPCPQAIVTPAEPDTPDTHVGACLDESRSRLFVSLACPQTISVDLHVLPVAERRYFAWYHPATGVMDEVQTLPQPNGVLEIAAPTDRDMQPDLVLVIAPTPEDFLIPAGDYGKAPRAAQAAKVFDW